MQDAVAFARNNISYFEDLIPEAGPLESAKSFREKKIIPLMQRLKDKVLGLYRKVVDLQKELEKLQKKLGKAERDRDHYKNQLEKEKEKNVDLLDDARDLMRVKLALWSEKIDAVIALERDRDASREAEHAESELESKRPGMDIPDFAIERIARCLLPMIQSYYESEEGKHDMAEWVKQQNEEQI